MGSFEQLVPGRKRPEDAGEQHAPLRLGDAHEAMLVQNALALLFYELRHRDADVSVVETDRKANSEVVRRAAEHEWVDMDAPVNDVTHPAEAFRRYMEAHPDKTVDIYDRAELMSILEHMGVDTAPPTLH